MRFSRFDPAILYSNFFDEFVWNITIYILKGSGVGDQCASFCLAPVHEEKLDDAFLRGRLPSVAQENQLWYVRGKLGYFSTIR